MAGGRSSLSVNTFFAVNIAFNTLGNPVYGIHCSKVSITFLGDIPTFRAPFICTSNCGSHPPAVSRLDRVIISRSSVVSSCRV